MTPDHVARLRDAVERAFADRALLTDPIHRQAVLDAVEALDAGALRVATREPDGWTVHAWLKQAILLYFALQPVARMAAGALEFNDKIPVKRPPAGVRVVPPGTVRYGAYV